MKKFIWAFAAIILFLPLSLEAQEASCLTRYEDEVITGVAASSVFRVELVKSDQTKAVVKIDPELEPYLRFTRNDDGVVTVGMRNTREMNNRERRRFNRLMGAQVNRTMELTLYLPGINTIRLSDVSRLTTADTFTGDHIVINLTGSSSLSGLNISGSGLRVDAGGASKVLMTSCITGDLTAYIYGSAEVGLDAYGVVDSSLTASGAARLQIKGDGVRGNWVTRGSARIMGEEFTLRELTANASGASSIRANVSESLSTHTTGSASVRYHGQPSRIHSASGASSVRPLE